MVLTDRPARDPVDVPVRRPALSPGRTALALGALGVAYRLAMLLTGLPPTNSDEAVTGLVAMHVAQGRGFPLFFYGQHYMGALEAYLAAPLFALDGPGLVALRLPNLALYALFLVVMWHLTHRLYHPWFATAVVGLLALGSDRILKNQLIAGGGYPEMNPAGALLVLLAVLVGLGAVRRRARACAAFGLVAGLTLWDDWLVLPYVAAAGALLLAGLGRGLAGRCGAALAVGLAVGLLPIVAHNLTAAPEHRSLAVYRLLAGGTPGDWADRLHGGVLVGLPMGTGFCAPGRCASWQLWWGVAAPVLLVVAGLLALRALRRWGRPDRTSHRVDRPSHLVGGERMARIRQGGRLALVGAATVSLAAYARSAAAGDTPVESARYLSCLLISLPALLWPIWSAARSHPGRLPTRCCRADGQSGRSDRCCRPDGRSGPFGSSGRRGRDGLRLGARAALAAVAVSASLATGTLVTGADALTRADQRRQGLVTALDRLGVRHFYADYWTCYPVVFATRERLVCGVIRDDLRAGWDRYPAYPARVARADRVAYVLPAGSALSRAVADRLAATATPVTRTIVPGYDIHLPADPVGLPLR